MRPSPEALKESPPNRRFRSRLGPHPGMDLTPKFEADWRNSVKPGDRIITGLRARKLPSDGLETRPLIEARMVNILREEITDSLNALEAVKRSKIVHFEEIPLQRIPQEGLAS